MSSNIELENQKKTNDQFTFDFDKVNFGRTDGRADDEVCEFPFKYCFSSKKEMIEKLKIENYKTKYQVLDANNTFRSADVNNFSCSCAKINYPAISDLDLIIEHNNFAKHDTFFLEIYHCYISNCHVSSFFNLKEMELSSFFFKSSRKMRTFKNAEGTFTTIIPLHFGPFHSQFIFPLFLMNDYTDKLRFHGTIRGVSITDIKLGCQVYIFNLPKNIPIIRFMVPRSDYFEHFPQLSQTAQLQPNEPLIPNEAQYRLNFDGYVYALAFRGEHLNLKTLNRIVLKFNGIVYIDTEACELLHKREDFDGDSNIFIIYFNDNSGSGDLKTLKSWINFSRIDNVTLHLYYYNNLIESFDYLKIPIYVQSFSYEFATFNGWHYTANQNRFYPLSL